MEWLNPTSLALFFAYTLVTLLAALVGRIWVNNMGDKAKNLAVEAVTGMVTDAVKDARDARQDLILEREKRANLEGRVDSVMTQATEEKRRADTAYQKLAKQDTQIDKLSSEVNQLTSDIKAIRDRLTQVEGEKKALEAEKHKLQNDLSTQSEEYRHLMNSIQERIDKAVADVREELRVKYEERITKLEQEISERDKEIGKLTALLKEKESHEFPNPSVSLDPAADVSSPADTGTGSNGSPTSPDTGTSADSPSSGGSPNA